AERVDYFWHISCSLYYWRCSIRGICCNRCSRCTNWANSYSAIFNRSTSCTSCRIIFPWCMGMCFRLGVSGQFSVSTSVGSHVGGAMRTEGSESQLIVYTKVSLLILTVLMVIFCFMRTEQSAWWNVLAWAIRNSATLAPVVAALFWRVVKKRAVLASLCTGFITGLSCYYLGGWDQEACFINIHPVRIA